MTNKSKGSKAERELLQMFVDNNFRAVRVAGSGTMEHADCDLIAGKKGKKYCIEVKSTRKNTQYLSEDQIERFIIFAEIFSLKPIVAVRFNRLGWFFITPKQLVRSGKHWGLSVKRAREKGKRFKQFFS